jgi:hypothetical protein
LTDEITIIIWGTDGDVEITVDVES